MNDTRLRNNQGEEDFRFYALQLLNKLPGNLKCVENVRFWGLKSKMCSAAFT